MPVDPLRELLKRADADAGPPPALPGDLATRVLRRAARRRRRMFLVSGVAAAALLALAVSLPRLARYPGLRVTDLEPLPRETAPLGSDVKLRSEIARLEAEAEMRLAVARRMVLLLEHANRTAARTAATARPDPAGNIRRQADQAAIVLMQQGDRLFQELHLPGAAERMYRCALRAFADTPWADVARQRLEAIQKSAGEHL